jgi:pimeloyl-ACP methyl ester carboxylesterase
MLAHIDQGSGPSIVFLHGFTLDRTMWTDACTLLRAEHRVLAFDLPGHGSSGALGEVSPAREVLTSMEALSTMGAVVVGSSLGAAVAIDLALERPSMIRAAPARP